MQHFEPFHPLLRGNPAQRGLNAFTASDIRSVTAETLSAYDVVILGDIALTTAQADMFSAWVTAGGQLIAMRPDKKLAGLLGLTDASATLSNSYLLVNTSTAAGAGIVGQTIQFHGTSDLYTLNGATSLAMLYSNATTATTYPAVTLNQVGTNGGQAAAFTYDLARSVVYTRQGNPAWAGQHRDAIGRGWITPHDLFYGAAIYDPQPDWVDFNKIAIPQADEQQRLLANLILTMNLEQTPLPRFWYFPRDEKAVVLMTGDDHGSNGTTGRFQHYQAISPTGCSVADWECIRSTSYIYTSTPLSNGDAAAFTADGFDVQLHVGTGCADFTPETLDGFLPARLQVGWPNISACPRPPALACTASCGAIGLPCRRPRPSMGCTSIQAITTSPQTGSRTARAFSPAPACPCALPTWMARASMSTRLSRR